MNENLDSDGNPPVNEVDAMRLHRLLLEDLQPEEFRQLEKDLLASASLRKRFMRAIRIDLALRDQSVGSAHSVPAVKHRSRWLQFSSVITAVAALLLLTAIIVWRTTPTTKSSQTAALSGNAEVATLVDVRDCKWADGEFLPLDRRFPTGVLELSSGVAVIEFDGGAKLALQGPASLELLGTKTARLHRGNATVRCEQGIYSFSLLTPTSTVVDLGTEFGVAVDSTGASEVHVLDGAVEVVDTLSKFEPGVRFLNVGQTLALASNGSDRILSDTTHRWIRDYSTPMDREAASSPPRLIARDQFPSSLSQPRGFGLGTGWKGAWWKATREDTGDFRFGPMGPLVKRDGSQGLAMLVGGWVEVRRVLEEPIDPTVSKIIYVGLSMHRLFPDQRNESGRLSEATFLLRSSQDPTSVLGMGLSPLNYWVVAEQGGWERSDRPESGKGPFFMVAKIEFNPLSGNRVSMMAFDKSEEVLSAEPEEWDFVTQRQHSKMGVPLDTVALRVRQSACKFGELTLGNSWQAVVDPSSAEH
jgi:hypothetical protein